MLAMIYVGFREATDKCDLWYFTLYSCDKTLNFAKCEHQCNIATSMFIDGRDQHRHPAP